MKTRKFKVVAVIPTKNEEKGIGKVIKSLKSIVDEIYIVDSMSTDRTREIARKLGAKVILEPRKGYGRAYMTGFKKVNADLIVTIDGDGSYSTTNLKEYIDIVKTNNVDFISCNRIFKKGSMNIIHRIGNKILTMFVNFLFNIKLKDSQSGMWIFKSYILDFIDLKSEGMPFSEEIKIKVLKNGFRFVEKPVEYYKRLGKPKLNTIKDGFDNFLFLFKLRRGIPYRSGNTKN